MLVRLGSVIRAQLRKQDLCCRWGGEEFVALADSHERDSAGVAQRTLSAIREADVRLPTGAPLNFTASVGICARPAAAISLDAMLRSADAAMYEAKASRRDRACMAQERAATERS